MRPEQPFDPAAYVGLPSPEALARGEAAGWHVQRVTRDMVVTMDFQPGRLRLFVDDDDVVVRAQVG